ncbi:MAG: tellurite resistance/C4-dicarboxylate transporter family protein [Gemmatimonadaceae bacterium]|nr:tellurite resistance/C4-dicarboxylate transporter family protein [Gemmatimonadaceae bacterium]
MMPTIRALNDCVREDVRDCPPASFALVMATGSVSIATYSLGMTRLGVALCTINVFAYVLLWALNLARLARYPRRVWEDLLDHTRGCGYYTVVAATCVLGAQLILMYGNHRVAAALWLLGVLLWIGLTFTIFTALTIKEDKPPLAEGINGAWLLAVVSTQSVALLSAELSTYFGPYKLATNFFALSMWLWGGMLYIWMISLIFYRYTFFKLLPGDLTPPYWINMGAMAISALAGTALITNTPHAPFLLSILPFIKGFTIFYWATGTWWLPMLVILAVWRHVYKRLPMTYDPLYWGAVFPLGMYTACTLSIARTMELDFLEVIPHCFVYVALAAWLATSIGLIRSLMRTLTGRRTVT